MDSYPALSRFLMFYCTYIHLFHTIIQHKQGGNLNKTNLIQNTCKITNKSNMSMKLWHTLNSKFTKLQKENRNAMNRTSDVFEIILYA